MKQTKKQYIEKYIEQGKTSIRKYSTSLKQKTIKTEREQLRKKLTKKCFKNRSK